MLERKSKRAVIRLYFALAITAHIADVSFYHSTIALGRTLDPIMNKLFQE